MPHLVIIGFGYSAAAVASGLGAEWQVSASVRRQDRLGWVVRHGYQPLLFDALSPSVDIAEAIRSADVLLMSAPPDEHGDPLLRWHRQDIRQASRTCLIIYLSTIGVYGDHQGSWVDETGETVPRNARSAQRIEAEQAWLSLGTARGTPVQICRLGGIYGPGRNAFIGLADGSQRRIVKTGQVFNRIHVEDIGGFIRAGLARPEAGPIFNIVDDEPAPPQDVIVEAARLMGITPPPEITLEEANLSPMGLSFYRDNRRVSNRTTKARLGYQLLYPSYREGLAALARVRDWEREAPPDA